MHGAVIKFQHTLQYGSNMIPPRDCPKTFTTNTVSVCRVYKEIVGPIGQLHAWTLIFAQIHLECEYIESLGNLCICRWKQNNVLFKAH